MNYRDKFYSKYVSTHAGRLYGEINLDNIRKQFSIWFKYFNRFLPAGKNAKIIDIGCGNGGFVYWLQQSGYLNAEGVDISGEQIEQGKLLGIKNIIEGNFMELLDRQGGGYDVIFMRDVIEHFKKEEILEILEKVLKILNNNGVLIIQTPNAESPFFGRLRYGDFTHELSFDRNSACQLLFTIGFKGVEVYPTGPVIHGIKSLIRWFFWKLIELCLKFYLLIETGSGGGIFTQNLIIVARKNEKI